MHSCVVNLNSIALLGIREVVFKEVLYSIQNDTFLVTFLVIQKYPEYDDGTILPRSCMRSIFFLRLMLIVHIHYHYTVYKFTPYYNYLEYNINVALILVMVMAYPIEYQSTLYPLKMNLRK
ncbi:hypothetical protein BDA99DRAFT_532199 [Phascolomyces articulosus]|uniref:Uncharacterized protein n=1 Tax=Phascolomyces articulosus TaxID=60185 RepID=A0AAD5KP04_9FUNG|nr:hypothetical protein BDA99DRAFT_532199 [Phascolomyces articulosus]